ncbi:MAG: ChaN family lipoprotein [Bdellovibrionales bacterium]
MKTLTTSLIIFFLSISSAYGAIFNGHDLSKSSLQEITSSIEPGDVLIVGELHDNQGHHDNQLAIIKALTEQSPESNIHLGMEFLNYTDQWHIYKYLNNTYSEEDFLKAVNWASPDSFRFYSPSINTVKENGGNVLGLNIPRAITSKVAKNGIDSLDKRDLALLPHPTLYGNENYYERFYGAVGGGHVPDEKIVNYFWAQSIWDDVMSETSINFMQRNPEDILVIFIGDFHVNYGGGLPDIFKRKGFESVKTISQTTTGDEIKPHEKYGVRADWIWVTD